MQSKEVIEITANKSEKLLEINGLISVPMRVFSFDAVTHTR